MRRSLAIAIACLALAGSEQTARAVFFDDAAHYMKSTFYENKAWPWPYQCPDRIAVREPFNLMVQSGWRRQNLLGSHHFNPDTNQLTTAGELRVQWILTQAPPQHRGIYVEHAINPEINAQRMAAVREYATQIAVSGQTPQIEETYLVSEGRPAAVVDATNVKFMQSMPTPVLPAATAVNTGQ